MDLIKMEAGLNLTRCWHCQGFLVAVPRTADLVTTLIALWMRRITAPTPSALAAVTSVSTRSDKTSSLVQRRESAADCRGASAAVKYIVKLVRTVSVPTTSVHRSCHTRNEPHDVLATWRRYRTIVTDFLNRLFGAAHKPLMDFAVAVGKAKTARAIVITGGQIFPYAGVDTET